MSSQVDNKEEVVKDKVVISPEDANAALDFWRHFNIPIAPKLQGALDAFTAEPNYKNQEKLKLEVCKAIAAKDHEAFRDDMFAKIVEECEGTSFEMQFDQDLEEEVTVKE